MITIYKLINPVDKTIFYVGATSFPLERRLKWHITESRTIKSKKCLHIKQIVEQGNLPIIRKIKTVSLDSAQDEEQKFINRYIKIGHPILNRKFSGFSICNYNRS